MKIHIFSIIYCIFFQTLSFIDSSRATDSLNNSQSLSVNESLISPGNQFWLGFFNLSSKFYLGIKFKNIPAQTVVWVANRNNPLNDATGGIRIANDGNLILVDKTERIIWSTGIKNSSSRTASLHLLDTGNLVLRDTNGDGGVLWQSFDHPSQALIAGMKLGWDLRNGLNRNLTSWRSLDDPSPGEYTFAILLRGLPQTTIWKGSSIYSRSGAWDGKSFGGGNYDTNIPFTPETIVNSEEVYYKFSLNNDSLVMLDLSYMGEGRFFLWDNSISNWREILRFPPDSCGIYGTCGPNSICSIRDALQVCTCLTGYTPKDSQQWGDLIWAGGCKRNYPLNCSAGEGFVQFPGVKLPDMLQFKLSNTSFSVEECRSDCLKNCTCTAYANLDSTGCLLWFEDLIDVRRISNTGFHTVNIRAAASDLEPEPEPEPETRKTKMLVVIVVTATASVVVLLAGLFFIWKKISKQRGTLPGSQQTNKENHELPFFDIATLAKATENFADTNKIGEGGFGPVYKGVLPNGQEIAVKRLSETSDQGLNEYKTEVMLIAKLQHRNLVRLLGWSIQDQQRMLIYEYMPNGSLDSYINGGSSFGKRHLLAWRRRFSIILGIARGVLYLHRDSRLRIIHRDIKASNVLLDREMNPKISDFGMARTFGEEQLVTKTKRVVGTFGYIAPEYAILGIFSMKSDVFSFGVLVLEIVSGQRINQFHHEDNQYSLLGHAWKLWSEGRAFELVDPLMEDSYPISEVLRCIQVGLLCVQEQPEDRPMMATVILMLDSETTMLPHPNRPGFYTQKGLSSENDHLSDARPWTRNELTDSIIEGR